LKLNNHFNLTGIASAFYTTKYSYADFSNTKASNYVLRLNVADGILIANNCILLTSLTIQEGRITQIQANNSNVKTLSISSGVQDSSGAIIELNNNNMSSLQVDTILIDLNLKTWTNGYIDLRNNAVPSSDGITAKDNLIAKGWTVLTN
jgi:hypothetical protein